MPLTPKEIGGGAAGVYPVNVAYSALLESGYSSTGAVAANATIALSFKPTTVDPAKPLSDSTNHYLLLIVKTGTGVEVFKNNASLGSYTTSATTYAGLLSEALTAYCGDDAGYYSRLHVVDGALLAWGDFFELSPLVADLWMWKGGMSIADYGTNGGLYTFANAAALGADASGNGNDWTITGMQSDDTPTHNGGALAWRALPEPVILDTSLFADALVRPGSGAAAVIDSYKFSPDFVTIKDRAAAHPWHVYDYIRGAGEQFDTASTAASLTISSCLTALISGGYELGAYHEVNSAANSYVDLALKESVEAGFDVVAYEGTGVGPHEIAHNLGKTPTMIIIKREDGAKGWVTYHTALGAAKFLYIDSTVGAAAVNSVWHNTEPTGTHFTVGNALAVNASGASYIAYVFTDSDVFKAFSYTGNNSMDGPVVDLGGRPLTIPFLKNTVNDCQWLNLDGVRSPANVVDNVLHPNASTAETADSPYYKLTFQSSGFKVSSGDSTINRDVLIVGLAILRQPFKYSNAF